MDYAQTHRVDSRNHVSPYQIMLSESQSQSSLATGPELSTTASLLPAGPLLVEVIDIYFHLIHNFPHTLFHKPSFWADANSGIISEMVLLGIIALSIRYV